MVEVGRMSQEEENLDRISKEELTQDEIKELVKKAINSGIHESMFILTLNEWNRPGSSFTDWGRFEVIYGEVEVFELNSVYEYPTTNETVYAIIPKTRNVIILHKSGNDYQGKMQKYQKLYIFSYSIGWKSLDLD